MTGHCQGAIWAQAKNQGEIRSFEPVEAGACHAHRGKSKRNEVVSSLAGATTIESQAIPKPTEVIGDSIDDILMATPKTLSESSCSEQ